MSSCGHLSYKIARAAAFLVVAASSAIPQQQSAPAPSESLSLDAILMRLQVRRWEYSRNVPDFFADELVNSEFRGQRIAPVYAVTASIFRLRRETPLGVYPPDLVETRTVRSTNGVTMIKGSSVAGPAILINAFSNGLSTITLSQKTCFDFKVSSHRDVRHVPVFAIDYRMKPGVETNGYCLPWRGVSGQALVEEDTFNVLRFVMHVPRYPVLPNAEGPWRWSIEYTPVTFDGAVFYMPQRIESVSETLDGRFIWTFTATYRNYHKTGVHSRIITDLNQLTPRQ